MIRLPELTEPIGFLFFCVLFFVIITGRYLVIAGLFYAIFYLWYPERWQKKKLSKRAYPPRQLKKELGWSMITSLLFSVMATLTLLLWQKGYTRVYTGLHASDWYYMPLSLVLSLALQETYYYWLHRWMHLPAVFKRVHKVHHQSNLTSTFTAFSFHPLEGFLQALMLPLTLLLVPLHPVVILVQLMIMSFSSVINHLNIEIYPRYFHHNRLGKWIVGATHHSLHHIQFRYNYGLYFTLWDKWKKTESPAYPELLNKTFAEDAPSPEKKN
ncbi:MAG: sterol desaturase family protein [Williamsia sp.]|nr:sterol desaturase family protein [Williamsia sp.]